MSFSFFKSLNPVAWIGDIISGVAGLFGQNQVNKNANHLFDKQVAAQQEANQYNVQAIKDINSDIIASQEKVNSQNIDFAREINSLMRRDSRNAISDKRADLMRAGYSTADPNLSGFSAASLSSPSLDVPDLTAPQISPEYTPDMVNSLINSKNSAVRNALAFFNTMSTISLQQAQASKAKSEKEGIDKNNAWIDLKENANYASILEDVALKQSQQDINYKTAEKIANDIRSFDTQLSILKAQLEAQNITNSQLADRLRAELGNVLANTSKLNSETDVNKIKQQIHEQELEFEKVVNRYAKYGINFKVGGIFNSIASMLTAETPKDLVSKILTNLVDAFTQCLDTLNPVDIVRKLGGRVVDHFVSDTDSIGS